MTIIIISSTNVYYEDYIKLSKVFNRVLGTQDHLITVDFIIFCITMTNISKMQSEECMRSDQKYGECLNI